MDLMLGKKAVHSLTVVSMLAGFVSMLNVLTYPFVCPEVIFSVFRVLKPTFY